MSDNAASSMRRDIASAYAVTGARVGSWVVVSAVVYRQLGSEAFGLLTLVRATVGILAYTSLGLGPAMVKMLASATHSNAGARDIPVSALAVDDAQETKPILAYARSVGDRAPSAEVARIYATGERLALLLGFVALMLAALYAVGFGKIHGLGRFQGEIARGLVAGFGAGTVCRLISEAPSALLQAKDRIALDNLLLAATEIAWGALTAIAIVTRLMSLESAGVAFLLVNLLLLTARGLAARSLVTSRNLVDWNIARQMLSLGLLIVLAQVADFLYAPTDCILITRYLGPDFVAYYSPAIQIDAGLLLLVTGLATVLYPRSAAAHASGEVKTLRMYYYRGTLVSASLLIAASAIVWVMSKSIFLVWFHDPMPQTQAILPLLLIHTVVGGSSAVGRSILLAMGKAKQFTAAVLIAGVSNVVLSFIFVKYAHLGLTGIVLGTIVAVIARCAIWIPWYVMRTLARAGGDGGETRS
jgi:O-antigen/teichoic acid export membrane protein